EMSVLAQANERHPQGCEFSTSVLVAEPHKGSKTQKKQATKGLLFIGADDETCRERSERNSEMSVLAQANERHPQGCEFSTSVRLAEPHKGSKTQKKQAIKGLLFWCG
ncbi:MAG: hypothetical protein J6Q06_04335, partial [Clostridia bacterium]|nr:hypothetical protein [Clostridia bacterium]